jgi:hypothetical protein
LAVFWREREGGKSAIMYSTGSFIPDHDGHPFSTSPSPVESGARASEEAAQCHFRMAERCVAWGAGKTFGEGGGGGKQGQYPGAIHVSVPTTSRGYHTSRSYPAVQVLPAETVPPPTSCHLQPDDFHRERQNL